MGEPLAVVPTLRLVVPPRDLEPRPSVLVEVGEGSLFQSGAVRVTRDQLRVGERTWALGDVQAVETARRTPRVWPYLLAVGLGGTVGLPLLSWLSAHVTALQGAYQVGLFATAVGLFASMAALLLVEDTHYLVLGLPGGRRRVFGSRDAQLIARLARTLRQARSRS